MSALLKRAKVICYNLSMPKKAVKIAIALAFAIALTLSAALMSACNGKIKSIYFSTPSQQIYLSDGGENGVVYTPAVSTSPKGGEYSLTSSNPSIVGVNRDGVSVTGYREGSVVLTASTAEGLTATMDLIVLARRASSLGGDSEDGYTVSFVSPYGSVAAVTVAPGETVSEPHDISGAPSGYTLYGWYTEKDYINEYDFSAPVTSDLMLWALWGAAEPVYEYSEADGKVYVAGFKYSNVPYKEIVVPAVSNSGKPVYGIREAAFAENASLEKVTLEEGISVVGKYAFRECTALKEITLPSSVTEIAESAFQECESLEKFTAQGNSLLSIGTACFSYCTALESVVLPDSVETVGEYAFEYCGALTEITLPASLKVIQRGAFRFTALGSVDLTYVTDIYNEAFWGVTNLKTVTGTDNLSNVGSFTFGRLGTGYARYATAYVNTYSNYEDGLLYLGDTLLYAYPVVTRGDYKVRKNTKVIAGQAFEDVPYGTVEFIASDISTIPTYGTYAFGQRSAAFSSDIQPALDVIVPAGKTGLYLDKWLTTVEDDGYYVPTVYSFALAQNIYERAYDVHASVNIYARTPFKEIAAGVYFDKEAAAATGRPADGIVYDQDKINYLLASVSDPNVIELDLYAALAAVGKQYFVDDVLPFAFSKLSSLTSVTLTNFIGYIGAFAFTDCPELKSVRFAAETVVAAEFSPATITSSTFNRSTLGSEFSIYVPATAMEGSYTNLDVRYRTNWESYISRSVIFGYKP